ncbi:MAG TPA: hypothetical protein VGP83_00970 [Pyrinomonadaceae bacterium]|jgi:hypothetical protein|nr:hypothetical protein [Pyrinomonadaceae bacterium]
MVTLLITSVFVFGLIAIAIFFWQKAANTSQPIDLPLPPQPAGLFSDFKPAELPSPTEDPKKAVIESATKGDRTALAQAHALNDSALYEEVLNLFIAQIDSEPKLLSLVSHVTRNELPVSKALAQRSIDYWKDSPDKTSTAKMLHLAALSDDAETFRQAVELALSSWRNGKLPEVSAVELQSLINGEFWVLSSNTRSSGAGFVLKRTLATAKRELEPTM